MNHDRKAVVERMLAAYGGQVFRWPEARMQGVLLWATSAPFRKRLNAARALDRALAADAPAPVDSARVERRLLATMGLTPEHADSGFGRGFAMATAAASLALGLLVGGALSDYASVDSGYAGLTEAEWASIEDDAGDGEAE